MSPGANVGARLLESDLRIVECILIHALSLGEVRRVDGSCTRRLDEQGRRCEEQSSHDLDELHGDCSGYAERGVSEQSDELE